MNKSRLALRNLLRSPRRTLLTMSAVIAGVGVFILGDGFVSGITENILISAIDDTVGHVMARPAGYPVQANQRPVDELLTITASTRSLLNRRAVAWTERAYFAPIAANGQDSLRVLAIGYDAQRDPRVFPRTHWSIEGRMPDNDEPAIAVSHRVARLLDLSVGTSLILQVRTHAGAMNALNARVAAVLSTHNAALDLFGVFVPAQLWQTLLATTLPSHISVKLPSRDEARPFAAELARALGSQAEVVTFIDETAELLDLQRIRTRSLKVVMMILMALAGFGIANTILMATYERVREIGTLRALGMNETDVLRLFMLEGCLLGLVGSLLGALWGGALTSYWAHNPIDFSTALENSKNNVSVSAFVYTRFSLTVIGATIAVGVLVATIASIYPARAAARISPADAVRD